MSEKSVLMVSTYTRGGMQSVMDILMQSSLADKAVFMFSHKDEYASVLSKIIFFAVFLMRFAGVLLTQKNIATVHLHSAAKGSFFRKSLLLILSKLFGKSIVFHIHAGEFASFYLNLPFLVRKYARFILKYADTVVAPSDFIAKDISQVCKVSDVKALYNPVNIPSELAKTVREDGVKLSFLGRITQEKGIYDLVDAIDLIKNLDLSIDFYGVGELEKFSAYINKKGLNSRVFIKGWVNEQEKAEVLQNTDILVLPSHFEAFGMVLVEAMGYEVPVIASSVGGVPEVMEDGKNGLLFNAGNIRELADTISRLVCDRNLRIEMGKNGRNMALNKFSTQRFLMDLDEIYSVNRKIPL